MQFRPCIDIHNGAVRQIVGGSLKDEGDQAITNLLRNMMRGFMQISIEKMVFEEDILYC